MKEVVREVNTMARSMVKNEVSEISEKELQGILQKPFTFIDFFAEWNMPCLMREPVIEELAEKFKGKIRFARVNIEDNSEIAKKFNVLAIPTSIFFKDGKEITRINGALTCEQFEEKLKGFLK